MLNQHLNWPGVKEVCHVVREPGLHSVALIDQIKQRNKGGSATKKKGTKRKAGKAAGSTTALSATDLLEAKKLVNKLGD